MKLPGPEIKALVNQLADTPPSLIRAEDYDQLCAALNRIQAAADQFQGEFWWPSANAWTYLNSCSGNPHVALAFAKRLVSLFCEHQPRSPGAKFAEWRSVVRGRLGQRILRSPFHESYLKFRKHLPKWAQPEKSQYESFRARSARKQLSVDERIALRSAWKNHPTISILLTTHGTDERWLREAAQSVFDQCYGNWQLCMCDDASGQEWITRLFTEWQSKDSRVFVQLAASKLGISEALNAAGAMATGEYVAFLDHDDILDQAALHSIVAEMQHRDPDIVYTDEDFIDACNQPQRPHFKPDWSPNLLNGCMYLGHFVVIRRNLFNQLNGFRSEFDGAQDYDLALRAAERRPLVVHVPYVAYHWRMHDESIAASPSNKPNTHRLGRLAVEEALTRRGAGDLSVVTDYVPNCYRLRRTYTRDVRARMEVVRYSPTELPLTRAVNSSNAEYFVFVDSRLSETNSHTLESLISPLSYAGVGIVGGKILRHDGRILHAGYALGTGDGTAAIGYETFGSALWPWLAVSREVSAVSGRAICMRRELFESLGGFDTELPSPYFAIDFCLRAAQSGVITFIETDAVFTLPGDELLDPVPTWEDWARFMIRWEVFAGNGDPFYSPNLT